MSPTVSPADKFTLHYQGMHDGWHMFRVPLWKTRRRSGAEAFAFRQELTSWLFNDLDGRSGVDWYGGVGAAPAGPAIPVAFKNGSAFCVLLRHLVDVVRLEQRFAVVGLSPDVLIPS